MADYKFRNRRLGMAIEAAAGEEEAIDMAADSIEIEDLEWQNSFELEQTNEHTGALDRSPSVAGGGFVGIRGRVPIKGNATPGTAPNWGVPLRACALSQTLTAADVAETAQGGDVSEITLDAGASAVDDIYVGMVITITAGTGSGQVNAITAYDGTTKVATVAVPWTTPPDATSEFAIKANALYRPVSTGLETATAHFYDLTKQTADENLLRKLIGGMGNVTVEIPTRGPARFAFEFRGILPADPSNVAAPASQDFGSVRPKAFKNAQAYLGGVPVGFATFSANLNSTLAQADDPAALYGFEEADITERNITGQLDPNLVVLSSRDAWADFKDGTPRDLWLRWGDADGNRVSLLLPGIRHSELQDSNVEGFRKDQISFESTRPNAGLFLCVH